MRQDLFNAALAELGASDSEEIQETSSDLPKRDSWPQLDAKALYGLPGEIVKKILPHTEADPVALLANILTGFGNLVGRSPHFKVGHTNHHLNLFAALVGETSKGRKGSSWSTPKYLLKTTDEYWGENCVTSGLSTGEGLIHHVRDQRHEKRPIKDKGKIVDYQDELVDEGVSDKRLLVVEEELSTPLRQMRREGNILSCTLREAWDHGDLHPLTKTSPERATGAHISIIGHITIHELLKHLSDTDRTNGLANRFLWLLVRRSKYLPNPQGCPEEDLKYLFSKLAHTLQAAKNISLIKRDQTAELMWEKVYPTLSEGKPGLLGAVTGRGEAQVMRLAALYALFDGTHLINSNHLRASLALWDYSEASAKRIFGNKTGDPTADKIYSFLEDEGEKSREDIYHFFSKNKTSKEINLALDLLLKARMVESKKSTDTRGRPKTTWSATS